MTVDHRDLKPANTCGQCRRGTLRPVDLGGCTWRYRGRDAGLRAAPFFAAFAGLRVVVFVALVFVFVVAIRAL
jgi:hypothetical protein